MVDVYLEWAKNEGIPTVEDFGVDLLAVETAPWARMGARGAYVHIKGRGDFLNVYVCEIPPGQATNPQKHLFEEVIYVLDGRGSTTIETAEGARHSFEWGTGSLFAIPLNTRYRFFNGSGSAPARLASVSNLPMMLNAFHNEAFIFDNDWRFPERIGDDRYFRGEGEFIPMRPGRHMWETNFVPSLPEFKLYEWKARGAGGSNIMFILAEGTMHAHMSEMPVGTYKKGHRHGADFHIFPVTGWGYSLLWYEGEKDFVKVDWKHGWVYAPPDMMFHQHFNAAPHPSRYLAVAYGNLRYPFSADKRATFLGMDVSLKAGGRQIEYQDENPRIHEIFEQELARSGVECRMHELLGLK
ncbi:MAG: cupin domain-containing protein [Chloroflexi bacterium]|nr:cupin domain-containing protein [Chloroflexota bacterium]